ncbi:MAG: V-type ATP synthase subunit E [Anaerolineales bacterium]|jgi:vacuolar-type H+-ATPase subunit E/Vma4
MSIQSILDAIDASGEARVKELEKQTQVEVREILAAAEEESQQLQEAEQESTVAPAIARRARILHNARLEALQIVGSLREDLVDAALNQARGHLSGLRTDNAYPAVLQRLRTEALDQIRPSMVEDAQAKLKADPRDKKLIEGGQSGKDQNLDASYDLECWGGLIATSEDGRVVAINTLEARLKQATPYLRRYLGAMFTSEAPKARKRKGA